MEKKPVQFPGTPPPPIYTGIKCAYPKLSRNELMSSARGGSSPKKFFNFLNDVREPLLYTVDFSDDYRRETQHTSVTFLD